MCKKLSSIILAAMVIVASLLLPVSATSAGIEDAADAAIVELSGVNYDRTGYPNTYTNTGDYAKDILGVALTQRGYSENSSGQDYTKYSLWYKGQDYEKAWCAIFVSWCADQAGIPTSIIRKSERAYGATYDTYVNGTAMFSNEGYFGGTAYDFGTKTPAPGDIFFSVTDSKYDYSTHVGLVWKVVGNTIYTIEGNTHFYDSKTGNYIGKVAERTYSLSTGYQYSSGSGYSKTCHLLFFVHPDYERAYTHTHSYKTLKTAATCTQQGYTTYTCSCGDTYKANDTVATGHAWDNGRLTTGMTETQDGVVTYYCNSCNAKKTAILPAGGSGFVDVQDSTSYYYRPVVWASSREITSGTSAFEFSPNVACTRGQVVTFLWRTAGEPKPTASTNPFTDVKSSDYYYNAVLWAVENGITLGTSSDTFSPNALCTRAQVVTFQWRAAGQPAPTNTNSSLTDVSANQYYYDAVLWAGEADITHGTSETAFSPNTLCTRGQIVTFLYRQYSNE